MTTAPKLALIGGAGDLPIRVAQRCEAEGREVFIIRLKGFADAQLHRWPGHDFGMAEIGKILKGSDVWMDSDEIRRRLTRMQRAKSPPKTRRAKEKSLSGEKVQ